MKRRPTLFAVTAAIVLTAGGLTPAASARTAAPPAPTTAAVGDANLTAALDTLLTQPAFDGSLVSLVVRDATTGEELYDRNGSVRLNPASNMKLLTSTAAMDVLGPDFRFHTDVLIDGPIRGGVLKGSLYLKGFGDPTTLAADYQDLAKQVRAAGIRQVSGRIVADDTYFDAVRLGSFWSWDDEPYYYSAHTSALTVAPDTDYDSGTVIISGSPATKVGKPAAISLTPQTSVMKIVNTSTTGAAGSDDTLSIERDHATNTVYVTGSVPADGSATTEWIPVWEPTQYAADVFGKALTAAGVRVKAANRTGATPAKARRIAHDQSMPLAELLTPFLKLSNNMHAEALAKAMGAQESGAGTWSAGLQVIADHAAANGVAVDTLRLRDGSGLSRGDQVTADALSDVLLAAKKQPWFDTWYAALPVAGNPDRMVGGTLRNRMQDTAAANNLHAKTGSLTGVSALSGYVTDQDGRLLTMSMMTNNFLLSPTSVENSVAVTLAAHSAGSTQAAPNRPSTALAPTERSTASTPDEPLEWCLLKTC